MTNTKTALKHLRMALGLTLMATHGVAMAFAADITPRSWRSYLAAAFGFSIGVNLVGVASVAYTLT